MAHLRQPWKLSFSAVAAVVAAFSFAIALPAVAQTRPNRPDLRITKATFNGRDLHVEYANATGVYDRRRYEVGFQWYDAAGQPVGVRHWLPQPEVERGGVAILDTKYRIDLTYRRSGGNYNRRLLDFILQRPNTAEELRVTVDDGDRIPEMDETNNVASLKIPLPDLQITGAKFLTPNRLELSYRNANPSPIPLPFRIGFTWAEEGGAYANATRWINVLEPAAGATETVVLSRTDASYITASGRQAGDRLDWYFERRPGNATRMKITIDDAGTVREQNEQNNLVTARPFLPDLIVRDAKFDEDRLTFTYGNAGEGYIRDIASRVVFQWVHASGKPVGEPRWRRFAQMDPGQTFTVDADRFDVEYAIPGTNRTATQRLGAYVRQRPQDATRLAITIDDEQRIIEANEQNNSAAVSPPPPPQPDLTITDATLTADVLEFTVRNLGPGATPPGQPVSLWFEWVDTADARVGALAWVDARSAIAPGQFLRFSGAYSRFTRERTGGGTDQVTLAEFLDGAPDTAASIKVHADGPNAIRETDEANNVVRLPVIPRTRPDLRFEEVDGQRITVGEPPQLRPDRLRARIRNTGERTLTESVVVEAQWVDVNGQPVGGQQRVAFEDDLVVATVSDRVYFGPFITIDSPTSPAAFAAYVTVAGQPSGATRLRVTIDPENAIRETDEANNAVILTPTGVIDLEVVSAELDREHERVTARIRNNGPESIETLSREQRSRVSVTFGWVDANGRRIPGPFIRAGFGVLTAGQEATIGDDDSFADRMRYLLRGYPADGRSIRVEVDDTNQLAEGPDGERNNVQDVTVFTTALPDLRIEQNNDGTVTRGMDPVFTTDQLLFTVRNRGHVTVPVFQTSLQWLDRDGTSVGPVYQHAIMQPLEPARIRASDFERTLEYDGPSYLFSSRYTAQAAQEYLTHPPRGASQLRITLDPGGAIAEINEGNNAFTIASPFPYEEPLPPDYVVGETSFVQGGLSVTYRNAGGPSADGLSIWFHWADASGAQVGRLYWSDAAALTAGGDRTLLSTNTIVQFDGGEIRLAYVLVDIPDGATHFKVILDGPNRIAESDETNNNVLLPIPVTPRPDFTITDPRVDADGKMYFTVRNIGTAGVTSLPVRGQWVQANGESIIGGDRIFSMSAVDVGFVSEQVAQSVLPDIFPAPDTAAKLRLIADPLRRYGDINEEDNVLEIALPPRVPDLAITDLALTADQATWKLRNIGDPIPPTRALTFVVEFQWLDQDGAPVGPSTGINSDIYFPTPIYVHNRSTGYSGSASSDYILRRPTGAVALRVTEDSANVIREKDETNNVAETALPPPPQPDLAFARVTPKWGGRDPKIEYVGTNRGTVDVERIVLGLQWLDASGRASGPSYAPFEVFDRLHAGATSSTWALPFWDSGPIGTRALGRYLLLPPSTATHLRLTLDPENVVPESDETNNTAVVERPASVPLSDLTITNARLAEGTFALTYQNIGSVHAGYFMTLSTWFEWVDASGARVGDLVWHDGESLDPKYAMHLDAATVVSSVARAKFPLREFLAAPPDGATHLKVSADGPNTLLESNEGNNVAVLARLAAPLPDLAFTNVFLVPPKRERLVIGFKNVGKAPASEFSWTMAWVDAAGKALGEPYEGTVPALKANWQYGASSDSDDPKGKPMFIGKWLAQPKPAGAVRLEITIDPNNRIAESNEENNRRTFDEWSPPALVQSKGSDFVVGAVEVKDGALRITARNIGADDAAATDIWLMWFGAKGALPSSGAVDLPAIAAGKEVIVRVPLDGKTEASNILRDPPRDGTRLRIFLDGSRKVAEQNEDNNDAMLDRAKLSPSDPSKLPDLSYNGRPFVTNFTSSPPELIVSIANSGKGPTDPFVWQMQWLDRAGKPLGDAYRAKHPGLPPGSFYGAVHTTRDSYALGVPMGTYVTKIPAGAATLDILLDPDQQLAESDETNNHATLEASALIVLGNQRPTADAGEDITERDDDGDGVEIVRFYSRNSKDPDGKIVSWRWTLADGKEVAIGQYPYWRTAPVGTHIVTLTVTDNSGLTATDTVRVTVEPKPKTLADLRVAEFAWEPKAPKVGDIVEFTARIENVGAVGATVSWTTLEIDLNNDGTRDVSKGQFATKSLNPGESTTFHWKKDYGRDFFWTATDGMHAFLACADSAGVIREVEEANNCVRKIVKIGAKESEQPERPDLTLRTYLINPANAYTSIQAVNVGDALSPPSAWEFQWVDADGKAIGAPFPWAYDRSLVAGQSVANTVQFKNIGTVQTAFDPYFLKRPAGAARMRVTVDPKNVIAELDETNNTITLDAPKVEPENQEPVAVAGKDVTVTDEDGNGKERVTLSSIGSKDPDGRVSAYWWWLVNVNRVIGKDAELTYEFPVGTHRVRLEVLDNKDGKGSDEVIVTVRPKSEEPAKPKQPDLVISSITITPAKLAANRKFTVSATVKNVGGASAPASHISFVMDLDNDDDPEQLPDNVAVPALAAGQSRAIVWDDVPLAPAGTHGITVCADVDEEVEEIDEDENCVDRTVMVGATTGVAPSSRFASAVLDVLAQIIFGGLGATPIVASDGR